ncbi:MAG: Nre family DNA repair protein [Candidatus Thermoplasmatota archaeon]|nr:Nre family DNA repair protein [Candidatus Thermoplasmatota archaeon]
MKIPASLCLRCRGAKMLCGLSYCPISVKYMTQPGLKMVRGNTLSGASPPSIFVGRYGYPKVKMYPSTPLVHGDTSLYEDPKEWMNIPLEKFLSMRLSMIRGGVDVEVGQAVDPTRLFHEIQLMALSEKSVEVEMVLDRNISDKDVILDEHTPPMGPSAPVRKFTADYSAPDLHMEKVYGDTDLKAMDAMIYLYSSGQDVSKISRILSVGAVGQKNSRKVVPTRWSITAVDKNLSDHVVEDVKDYRQIDKFIAFVRGTPGNLFMAVLTPSNWIYEWGESWFPGSTWNQWGEEAYVEIDDEGYYGRTDYPGIGGCYYSTRLATAEKFASMKRSGGAITWREIYPGFNLPVGVWYVRENMRALFNSDPVEFDTLDMALAYISRFMKVPLQKWTAKSNVVKTLKYNNLDRFFMI